MATIYEATKSRPRYLDTDLKAEFAGDNPDYFEVKTNKWYSTSNSGELVTNGTFDSSTTGWTAGNSASISIVNSTLKILNGIANYGYVYQALPTIIGKQYTIYVSVSTGNINGGFFIGTSNNISDIYVSNVFVGTVKYTFTANTTTTYISLQTGSGTTNDYCYFDNISVFQSDLTIGSEITPRNYLNNIVYADHNGQPEYVEEVAKVEYKDSMKLNKLSVTEGFDLGQTWQNMTSQRVAGATYTNTTGKSIAISIRAGGVNVIADSKIIVDNIEAYSMYLGNGYTATYTPIAIIPSGSTYRFVLGGTHTFDSWKELR